MLFLCLPLFPLTLLSQEDNIQSERPDHRMVQFWDPNIFTENRKASVSFFSSDNISRYKVYVEGITNEGKICLGTASFEVDKVNEQRLVK